MTVSALEPEWEARFEPRSYGFRPGRGCHDAIAAIFWTVAGSRTKRRWALDADLKAAFDHASHDHILRQLGTFPARERIAGWLKAGVIEDGRFAPTEEGTPRTTRPPHARRGTFGCSSSSPDAGSSKRSPFVAVVLAVDTTKGGPLHRAGKDISPEPGTRSLSEATARPAPSATVSSQQNRTSKTGLRSKYFRCSGRCVRGGQGWSSGRFRRPERALAPGFRYRQWRLGGKLPGSPITGRDRAGGDLVTSRAGQRGPG
jgi:hypothetical protein